MEGIFQVIISYLWFIIKLILLVIVTSIPFIILTYIFKNFFNKLRKKKSYLFSISFIIYIISLVIILLVYFIPIIGSTGLGLWNSIGFVVYHIIRLAIINLLLTAILVIFAFIVTALYEKLQIKKTKKQKRVLSLRNLCISISLVLIIIFIIILLFPKLLSLIIFMIFL